MSRPISSPSAPVQVGPCLVPLLQAKRPGSRTLRPGYRIVAGRIFYSAAWLDETGSSFWEPLGAMATPVGVADARYGATVEPA